MNDAMHAIRMGSADFMRRAKGICTIFGSLALSLKLSVKFRQLLHSQRLCWLLRMPGESMTDLHQALDSQRLC